MPATLQFCVIVLIFALLLLAPIKYLQLSKRVKELTSIVTEQEKQLRLLLSAELKIGKKIAAFENKIEEVRNIPTVSQDASF